MTILMHSPHVQKIILNLIQWRLIKPLRGIKTSLHLTTPHLASELHDMRSSTTRSKCTSSYISSALKSLLAWFDLLGHCFGPNPDSRHYQILT